MTFEITKQNKKAQKQLFVMHILNGSAVFSIDRENGRIVEIEKISMKNGSFRAHYEGTKTSFDWSVSVGETYAYKKSELFEVRATIIASKMR